jgi:methylenetetrahydrofolate reductase (NADPH)
LHAKRTKENVRPIFWKNRTKSYIQRTESWDEFPNGRWGDSRSPAFGELDGYGVNLKYPTAECLQMWGQPSSLDDIAMLFAKYCKGTLPALPWCAQQLDRETDIIRQRLSAINLLGYLTINSQPAVNGVKSSDKTYGWGPKNGYVFQKAYLEFFISPEQLDVFIRKINTNPEITYFAVNNNGDLRTNTQSDTPNAVTWGVFPGKEIIQPTIVESAAFMAWKDEAFELWQQWAYIYDQSSESAKLVQDIHDNWYLINIVNNDFQDEAGIWRYFDLEIDGEISRKLRRLSAGSDDD